MNLLHSATDHFVPGNVFTDSEHVLSKVIGIYGGRHKIHRYLVLRTMSKKRIHPGCLGRRGSAYTKPRINLLDYARGVVIELPICRLLRFSSPKIDIRLIPDL